MGRFSAKYFDRISYAKSENPDYDSGKADRDDFYKYLDLDSWTVSEAATLFVGYRLDSYFARCAEELDEGEFNHLWDSYSEELTDRDSFFSEFKKHLRIHEEVQVPKKCLAEFMGSPCWIPLRIGMEPVDIDLWKASFPLDAFLRFARDVWFEENAMNAPCFGLFHDPDAEAKEAITCKSYKPIQEPLEPEFARRLDALGKSSLVAKKSAEDEDWGSLIASAAKEEDSVFSSIGEEDCDAGEITIESYPAIGEQTVDYSFSEWFEGEHSPLGWILPTIKEWSSRPVERRTADSLRRSLDLAAKKNGFDGLNSAQEKAIECVVLPNGGKGGRGKRRKFSLH